jgi:uncharacterized protein YprB with RNaseH-like and TPR domain
LQPAIEAYLDIETTGLSPRYHMLTVVGIYITAGLEERMVQLVGEKICSAAILGALQGVDTLYTYNGSRFDLPFIHIRHSIDLSTEFRHCDLMYHCWEKRLYGGLKSVERQLCIPRKLTGVSGYDAIRLWHRYTRYRDESALHTLLEYNKEDVVNLKALRERLLP